MRSLLILLVFLIWSTPANGQAALPDSPQDWFASGLAALEAGDMQDAESYFKHAVSDSRSAARAHYYLARLYLDQDNAGAAHRHLSQARDLEPDNIEFITERIRQLRSSKSFFGSEYIREGERMRLGKRLVELDSTNALGWEEIGIVNRLWAEYYMRIRTITFDKDSISYPTSPERAEQAKSGAEIALEKTVELNPYRVSAHEELLRFYVRYREYDKADRASIRMRTNLPNHPYSWIWRGLVLSARGEYDNALPQFERGLVLMPPGERDLFDPIDKVFARGDSFESEQERIKFKSDFFAGSDPRLLSEVNERLVSHYARIAYSDLIYPKWRSHRDVPEYITPGDVIIRYGLPGYESRSVPKIGLVPSKLTLVVGRRGFLFVDEYSSEDWIVPSGSVIGTRSRIAADPQGPDPPKKRPFPMPYLVSRFRGESDIGDVVVTYGVALDAPDASEDIPIGMRTGVFLVDDAGRKIDTHIRDHDVLARVQLRASDSLLVWTNVSTLKTRPGVYTVHVEAENEDMVSYSSSSLIMDSTWTGFGVSDPLLAHGVEERPSEAAPGQLSRNRFLIRPAATRLFSRNTPIHVYYEVYDLTFGADRSASYQMDVVLEPIDEEKGILGRIGNLFGGRDSPAVAASFTSRVNTSDDATYQILDLSGFEAGTYRIALQVRDHVTGQVVRSEQVIVLQ